MWKIKIKNIRGTFLDHFICIIYLYVSFILYIVYLICTNVMPYLLIGAIQISAVMSVNYG